MPLFVVSDRADCTDGSKSAIRTAKYETPSNREQTPMPTLAIRIPAMAGPITREPVKAALFKLTAFVRTSSPTIST